MTAFKLTTRKIAAIKATGQKQVFNDGNGLRLIVEPNGNKRWLLRRMINGKDKENGLGGFPAVSLDEARVAAAKIRSGVVAPVTRIVAAALDSGPTVQEAVTHYYNQNPGRFPSKKAGVTWWGRMEKYVFPLVGSLRFDEFSSSHAHDILAPIWLTHTSTARRVRVDLNGVIAYGVVKKLCKPEAALAFQLAAKTMPRPPKPRHFASMEIEAVPGFLRDLADMDVGKSLKLCMAFLVLTGKRSTEARLADWSEYDEVRGLWNIPAERMKTRVAHMDALSSAAIRILRIAKEEAGDSRYMFTNPVTGAPYSDCPLLDLVAPYGATVHGFRATFKSWARRNGYDRDLTEMALAHKAYGDVEGAYQRDTLVEQRRALAEDWAKAALGDRPVPQLRIAA